jgi:hypothetical protein
MSKMAPHFFMPVLNTEDCEGRLTMRTKATDGVRILILGTITLALSGCALLSPIKALTTDPAKPATETKKTTKDEYLEDKERGLKYRLKETTYNHEVKKVTFGQRIGAFIAGLSNWAIILIIVGIIFFPGATLMFLVGRIRALGKALFQTVKGIQHAKRNGGHFMESLNTYQDEDTKTEINKLRAKL